MSPIDGQPDGLRQTEDDVDFSDLLRSLPPIIAHAEIERYLGGIISRRYLANLNSRGEGPKRFRFGRKVGYKREDLVEWLELRSQNVQERPTPIIAPK